MMRFSKLFVSLVLLGLAATAAAPAPPSDGSDRNLDDLLSALPTGPAAAAVGSSVYRVTSTLYNRDLAGKTTSKVRLTARYTRSVEGEEVSCVWNDARIAAPPDPSDPFPPGAPLDFLDGFDYRLSGEILGEDLYRDVPGADLKHLVKTLVWDAAAMEPPFWDHFDRLELNRDYVVPGFEDTTLALGNWGALRMKNLRMRWAGVSKVNGETCAVILYRSLANPVRQGAAGPGGRSLYWGTIDVSLGDKQVQVFTMIEDVILEMPAAPGAMNLQREVRFDRLAP
jgi:hypothetical protein